MDWDKETSRIGHPKTTTITMRTAAKNDRSAAREVRLGVVSFRDGCVVRVALVSPLSVEDCCVFVCLPYRFGGTGLNLFIYGPHFVRSVQYGDDE